MAFDRRATMPDRPDVRHRRNAHLALAGSVVCFASTMSLGALAGDRLGSSHGRREYLAFGPVQTVRYAVSIAVGISVVLASRRAGPLLVLPAPAQRWMMLTRLVLPQVFASGLLYLAFHYGDPAIAGAVLFSSAFFSLCYSRYVEHTTPRLSRVQAATVSLLLVAYGGGLLSFLLGGGEIAGSVKADEISTAITLSVLAAIALAIYVSSVGFPYTTAAGDPIGARDRTIAVSVGVMACSAVVAIFWGVVPGSTDRNWHEQWRLWTTLWPILLLGVMTYWANELMIAAARRRNLNDSMEPEPTRKTVRNAALTWEPLLVIGFALLCYPFREQIPRGWDDRGVEIVGCVLMAVGATGAAVVAGNTESSE